MIKRIVVAGIINGAAHVVYDVVVKPQRASMVKIMCENTWEEVNVQIFDGDQEAVIGVPKDWGKTVELCNWVKAVYVPIQVLKCMPVQVGGGKVQPLGTR